MKPGSLIAVALVAGGVAFASAQQSHTPSKPAHSSAQPSGLAPVEALLFEASSASSKVSYTGTVVVMRLGSRSAEASIYRIEHAAPDRTRRVYSAPSLLSGDSVVNSGAASFAVDAKRHRIVETRNDAAEDSTALNANFTLLRDNYRIVRTGMETFDGRRTIDVMLISKRTKHSTMLVRIDEATKIVLDKEEFAPDGSLVSEVRFDEIRFERAVPSSHFALPKQYAKVRGPVFGEPSEDLDGVVRRAGFAAHEPQSLPDGFSPVAGNLVELRGVLTVHFLYSDGVRTVSLFENAKASALDMARFQPQALQVDGRDAQYAEDGSTALLAWSDGNLHYTLVGELGLVDLRQIATAIEKP
jgi:negative regulator of sigma E activity